MRFHGVVTILADRRTPYRLLTRILSNAGEAEFRHFHLAVLTF